LVIASKVYSGELKQPMTWRYLHVYMHVVDTKRPAGFVNKIAAWSRYVVSLMACVGW